MATTRFIDIRVRSRSAERNVDRLDNRMKGLGRTADNTVTSFGNLTRIAASIGTALATNQILRYADAFTSVQNQIRQTVNTTQALTQRTAQLINVANTSRAGIAATAELYTQLNLSTESLNLSTEELLRLTQTISSSFAVSGQTAAESAGAIRQLGQAFASGALRGDEFNSIAEGAPEIMRALQRELNLTQGQLRAFAATGGITAEVLVRSLEGAADIIDTTLSNAVVTFSQNIEIANNNLIDFVGGAESIQGATSAAGSALVDLTNNLELIGDLSIALASIFVARLVPALASSTVALIANTTAQLTQVRAVSGVSAALGVQSVAITRNIALTNAGTIAARGFTAAMALVGGPLGVATLAAIALAAFVISSDDAGESARLSADEIDEFSASLAGLTRATRANQLNQLNDDAADLRVRLTAVNTQIRAVEQSSDPRLRNSTLSVLREQAEDLNDELDLISQRQGLLVPDIDTSGFTSRGSVDGGTSQASNAAQSAFSIRLSQETQQLQTELNLRNAIQHGFINEEEASLTLSFLNKEAQAESQLNAELQRLGTDEQAKNELREQFSEARLLQEQLFQQDLLAIEAEGSAQRVEGSEREAELKRLVRESDINNAQGLAVTGLQVLKTFGDQSFKTQKRFAIAESIVNIAGGVAKALNNPYPANLGFAAQVALQGASLLSTIKSSNPTSSGGSVSISGASASSGSFQPSVQQSVPQQNRVVDIRLDDDALLTGGAVKQLLGNILSSDEDVTIQITEAQQELVRVGGI